MKPKRSRRWPEEAHMTIAGAVTIALVFGVVIGVGYFFPPTPAERQIQAGGKP